MSHKTSHDWPPLADFIQKMEHFVRNPEQEKLMTRDNEERHLMIYACRFPLIIRTADGDPWAFNLPQSLYAFYGGDGGPVIGIQAVDPD